MGRVHNEVKTLCGERVDHRVRVLLLILLIISVAVFGIKAGLSLNFVGFSGVFRMDFLNMNGFNSGFLTDFSEIFAIYLNKEMDFWNVDANVGGFFGASGGNFSFGLNIVLVFYKRGSLLFGISSAVGIQFLSIGPAIQIDI